MIDLVVTNDIFVNLGLFTQFDGHLCVENLKIVM